MATTLLRLQWGRDQLIAEIVPVRWATANTQRLQWGRDQLIAEIAAELRSLAMRTKSFNGAAIS